MSPIYHNIFLYRVVMNLLYLGRYYKRFEHLIQCIDLKQTTKIVELAFGDIHIAKWAKSNNIDWIGFDINKSFVLNATKNGYQAFERDLGLFEDLPDSDLTIMAGSLYHFHGSLRPFIDQIMRHTKIFMISEPVKNVSSMPNIIGKIARSSANVNKGKEVFRYTEVTLVKELTSVCMGKYQISKIKIHGKDMIIQISHL